MRRQPGARAGRPIGLMIACFYVGGIAGWWLRSAVGPVRQPQTVVESDRSASAPAARPVPASGQPGSAVTPLIAEPGAGVDALQQHALRMPVDGVNVESLRNGFAERRSGEGDHPHEAVDILAPRNTPVHAVEGGTIAKLFESKAGGHTIYQYDPTRRFAYYYAHLERYAEGLHEGQPVTLGEVIGYVGTSGNAPPGTPHLHFAISELGPDGQWWAGKAIDPYPVFKK